MQYLHALNWDLTHRSRYFLNIKCRRRADKSPFPSARFAWKVLLASLWSQAWNLKTRFGMSEWMAYLGCPPSSMDPHLERLPALPFHYFTAQNRHNCSKCKYKHRLSSWCFMWCFYPLTLLFQDYLRNAEILRIRAVLILLIYIYK